MGLRMACPPASNLATSLSWADDSSIWTKTIGRPDSSVKTSPTVGDLSAYNDVDDDDVGDAVLISCWNLLNGDIRRVDKFCFKQGQL